MLIIQEFLQKYYKDQEIRPFYVKYLYQKIILK